MNYIRHLNAFFSFVRSDNRLTSSHVSLYMALFQYWNFNRFQNPFPVYRENMMQLSKIGSKNTYHKCIKELHQARYIYHHPPAYKFQPVRITMVRLDIKEEKSTYKQLDLFPPPEGVAQRAGGGSSTDNDTASVPNLTATSTDNDTGTVPKMGQTIKPNIIKQRETPTHEISKSNKKIQNTKNDMAGVPKLILVTQSEIDMFFQQNNYPATEAKKFFNHYKAIGWKIQGVTPIEDWKALVVKWMANTMKWDASGSKSVIASTAKQSSSENRSHDIQYLYECFVEGKKIFHHIKPDHFDLLKPELTEETMQQAWQERTNEVSGTNQHSLNQLWQAYLTNDPNNTLVQKDKANLIALAKRIEVLKHFQQQKQSGKSNLQ